MCWIAVKRSPTGSTMIGILYGIPLRRLTCRMIDIGVKEFFLLILQSALLRFPKELKFIEPRLEDKRCSEDDEQQRALQRGQPDQFGNPAQQRKDAQECGEAAHPDLIEVACRVQPKHDDADTNGPQALWHLALGHKHETTHHDQEQAPGGALETFV